jgi:hypothetical protein
MATTIGRDHASGQEADVPKTITPQRPAGLVARLASALRDALGLFTGPAEQPPSSGSPAGLRHQRALAVLVAARGVVRRGWVQHTWFVMDTPAGRRPLRQRFFPGRVDHAQVREACLIGAVLHAAWQQSPRPEYVYPAIDALWHALFDVGTPPAADPVGPLCPPLVRAARVRDLTTWNDRPYRTPEEVLDLLDRAVTRLSPQRPQVGG